jgi:hypothetical protein
VYYKSKTGWGDGPTEEDLMQWTPKDFEHYCCTKAYRDDYAMAFGKPYFPFKLLNRARSASINKKEQCNIAEPVTLHDIHQCKKQFPGNERGDTFQSMKSKCWYNGSSGSYSPCYKIQ